MKGPLVAEIAVRCAKLAVAVDESGDVTFGEYVNEYVEQLEDGTYLTYLKSWIGWMIESGSKEAVEIMKRVIRCEMKSTEWEEA